MFRKPPDPGAIAPAELTVTIDGQTVIAEPGESVAAVLLRLDPPISRTTPVNGSPRTPYCMMGVCFECLANVDGVGSVQTCLVPCATACASSDNRSPRAGAGSPSRDEAIVGVAVSRNGIPRRSVEMTRAFDLLIVGAGPAGMSAALRARNLGLSVLVVDDQQTPGGQIWRAVEAQAKTRIGALLGENIPWGGLPLTQAFRSERRLGTIL